MTALTHYLVASESGDLSVASLDLIIGKQYAGLLESVSISVVSIAKPYLRDPVLNQVAFAMAAAGQEEQARAIARNISSPHNQAIAMADIAVRLAASGQLEAASRAAEEAEAVACSIPIHNRFHTLREVVKRLPWAGQYEQAQALARLITGVDSHSDFVLAEVALDLAVAGHHDAATQMAIEAEEEYQLCPAIHNWAAELCLTEPDPAAQASQPPV